LHHLLIIFDCFKCPTMTINFRLTRLLMPVLCFLGLFSISSMAVAQDWYEIWRDPNTSFDEKKAAFNQNFQGKDLNNTKGWKQFKRYEYYYDRMIGQPRDFNIARQRLWENFENHRTEQSQNLNTVGAWTFIGPSVTPSNGGGAGRINAVEFVPGSTDLFVGAPNGGVWRRTATTWSTNTDNLSFIGFSDVVINPQNSNQMYAATGDADGGDARCIGVLKSNDGGLTWASAGLANVGAIYKIMTFPGNFNKIIAGTNLGVFLTTDGGATWTNTLTLTNLTIFDLEFKPGTSDIIYACSANNLFMSIDGGMSFANISAAAGTPTTGGRRRAIAVTPANPNLVYLIIVRSDNNGFHSFWRSNDGGGTFSRTLDGVTGTLNLLGWSSTGNDVAAGGQGWFDLAIAADPLNENVVFVGGVNIWRTSDGGNTWTINGHWTGSGGAPYVHADIHSLDFNSNRELYAGTDGGVFLLTSITGAPNWVDISNGLQVAQMYRLGAAQTGGDGLVITGWQDNGTNLRQSSISNWRRVIGGDGMESVIDPANPSIMMGEIYYGRISRSMNGGNSWSVIVGSGGTAGTVNEDGPWVTNYGIAKSSPSTYYVGKTNVYKSINSAASFTASTGIPVAGQINALGISPTDPNFVYASKGNQMYVSTDGVNFVSRNTGLPGLNIGYISVHAADPNIAFATTNGFTSGQKVYMTTNGGQNWTNISRDLPNTAVYCVTVNEQAPLNQLYIGTETGVFYTNDTLARWIPFDAGLPNTEVSELEIVYNANKIIAATYGRGAWESPLFAPPAGCGNAPPVASFTTSIATACPNQSISLVNTSTDCQSSFSWSMPGGTPANSSIRNPAVAYSTPGTYEITLTVTNPGGTATTKRTITVTAAVTHTFSISASTTDICAGQAVTFTSTSTNGGASPVITWLRNGTPITGTAGQTSITLNNLNQGDVISCQEQSSLPCASPNSITTSGISMTVTQNVTHTMSIATSKLQICADESAIFQLTAANSGNSPTINWFNNGTTIPNSAGRTSITLSNLADGATITAVQTSNARCVSPVTVNSNPIRMTVTPRPAKPVITQNVGDLLSSISTGNQWFDQGTAISNANGALYRPAKNGVYQTQVTVNSCTGPLSDPVTMNINGVNKIYPVPSVNGHFTFEFYAPEDARNYTIQVFGANGQMIHAENGGILPGLNRIQFKWSTLGAGMYYLRAVVGSEKYNKTLMVR
jgi:PKD repeat protein